MKCNLYMSIEFEGVENLKNASTNYDLKLDITCTGKTSVKVKMLES